MLAQRVLNSHDTEKSLTLIGENPVAEVPDRNLRSPGQLKNKLSNVWRTHMLCVLHVAPAMGCFLVRAGRSQHTLPLALLARWKVSSRCLMGQAPEICSVNHYRG